MYLKLSLPISLFFQMKEKFYITNNDISFMLDIHFIRNHPEVVKKDLEKRYAQDKIKHLNSLLRKDKEWRKIKQDLDNLRKKRNELSKQINELKKQKKPITKILKEVKTIPKKIKKLEEKSRILQKEIKNHLLELPNLMHEKVPKGRDEKDNPVIKKWGKIKKQPFKLLNHAELLEKLNLADFETARKNSGQGFNYLKGEIAMLDLAIQRYGMDFAMKQGFIPVVPPLVLRYEALLGALNGLEDFKDVVYKIENEDLYLVGTAEHSLVTMQRDKTMKEEDLPLKLCAVTPCFRKEIGGHGVDMKGLFRMHQFNKVEQVVFTSKENSYKMMEEMQKITEKFIQNLKIPYRVVEICSGDLGAKFARQWDIEAWFPRQKAYREITSAGNCTDYQSRALNIKYFDKDNERKPVHILNNTMVATSRAMVAILENYQQKDGTIKIPSVLVPYMNGLKKITKSKAF